MKSSVKIMQLSSDYNNNFMNILNDKSGMDEAVAVSGCHNEKTYLLTAQDGYGFMLVQTENLDEFLELNPYYKLVNSVKEIIKDTL